MTAFFRLNAAPILAALLAAFPYPATPAGPAWPATNSEADGVLWYWGTQTLTGEIVDADGHWAREGEAILRHQARTNWFHGVSPRKGFLEAADTGPALARAMESSPALYLEAAIHPPPGQPAQGVLFWLGTFEDALIWQLRLQENRLWIDRPDTPPLALADLSISDPAHFAFAVSAETASIWINGERVHQSEAAGLPVFDDPWDVIAVFGGAPDAPLPFNGSLEYLLLGTQSKTAAQHAQAWQTAHASRNPPEIFTLRATLTAHATEPREEDLSEYGNALLGTVWTVQAPLGDELQAGDSLFAWHAYVLNSRVYPDTRPPEPGSSHTLTLSRVQDQPQLEGIQQLIDNLDPDQLLLLPDFYLLDIHPGSEGRGGE